jgi:hypothetical protein
VWAGRFAVAAWAAGNARGSRTTLVREGERRLQARRNFDHSLASELLATVSVRD